MHNEQARRLKLPPTSGVPFVVACGAPQPASKSSPASLSRHLYTGQTGTSARPLGLYSPEERRRRDQSGWTLVQGILAPIQFAIFLVSLALVARYLATGEGLALMTASIVAKTIALYAIMITGCLWERAVFGRYLFAPAFYWEDVFSMLVLALHTGYLVALATGALDVHGQIVLALAAYAAYVINAGQFLLKLRAARLQGAEPHDDTSERVGLVP